MSRRRSTKAQGYSSAGILAACVIMTCALFCRASANDKTGDLPANPGLKVYLPREVTVKDSDLSLGQISIIRGNVSLAARANKITFGRISVPGQKIIVDRHMVLSRLACNGIPASKVTLTGAEKTTVKQQYRIISGDQFIAMASSFIDANSPRASTSRWHPMRKPKDFAIPGTAKDLKFSSRLLKSNMRNQARVEIAVLSGGKKIGAREVILGLKYKCRHAVAKVDIAAGAVIGMENVKIEEKFSNYPEPAGWKPPYGLIARRSLRANTVLRPNMAGPVKSPIVVKRNQNVVIRIERPGFLITAVGTTMQDGKAGEYIKIRNVDSQRIIVARINADGSVEPVL
ncbi:MAG: flagellar basal body P-ring formation chaperone FlgA [Planctomycetota bacterium]